MGTHLLHAAMAAFVAHRTPNLEASAAIRTCWREVNAHFGVSTYTDLPAARYDEIV